jgi:glycine C-acetyltransferase
MQKTIVFADSHCHASLVSGFKLSNAKIVYFKHNSLTSLNLLLNWYVNRNCQKLVVTESLFSTDGTMCHLPELRNLCDKHKALLVIDEAHGLGTLGLHGKGVQDYFNMPHGADIIVGTFSKSLSNLGGYICGTKEFITPLNI